MKNLRVAFLNCSKHWGGGEKWHFNTAYGLQNECDQVYFVGHPDGVPAQRLRDTKVRFFPMVVRNLSFLNPVKQLRMAAWLRQRDIDTLVINSPAEVRFAAPAARLAGVRNVVFRRGMPHPIKNNWVNRRIFSRYVDRVIANSQEIARSLNAACSTMVDKDKIAVIYNGIDLNKFGETPSSALYSKDDSDLVLLGTAGRLVKQKNQQVLLQVASRLKQQKVNFRLLIAGTGELEAELRQQVSQLELEEHVVFLGFVKNIKDLLCHIDVFVFPSLYEGSANALIEAGAASLPMIAFDVSSNGEIIEHNHNGLLATLGDVEGFTAHCLKLIQGEPMRQSFGEQAYQDVVDKFNHTAIWQKICKVLIP